MNHFLFATVIFMSVVGTDGNAAECQFRLNDISVGHETVRLAETAISEMASKGYEQDKTAASALGLHFTMRVTTSCPLTSYPKRTCEVSARFVASDGSIITGRGYGEDCYNENSGCFDATLAALSAVPTCPDYKPSVPTLAATLERLTQVDGKIERLNPTAHSDIIELFYSDSTFRLGPENGTVSLKATKLDSSTVTMRVETPEEVRELTFPAFVKMGKGFHLLHRYNWDSHVFYLLSTWIGDGPYTFNQFMWEVGGIQKTPIELPARYYLASNAWGPMPPIEFLRGHHYPFHIANEFLPFSFKPERSAVFFIRPVNTKWGSSEYEAWMTRYDLLNEQLLSKELPNQGDNYYAAVERPGVNDRFFVNFAETVPGGHRALRHLAFSPHDLSQIGSHLEIRPTLLFRNLGWHIWNRTLVGSDLRTGEAKIQMIVPANADIFRGSGDTLFLMEHLGTDWRYGIKLHAFDVIQGRRMWTSATIQSKYQETLAYENGVLAFAGYIGLDLGVKKLDKMIGIDLTTGMLKWGRTGWRATNSKLVDYGGRRALELKDVIRCLVSDCSQNETFPLIYMDFDTGDILP